MAEAAPRVGAKDADWAVDGLRCIVERVDALLRGEISLDGAHVHAKLRQTLPGFPDFGAIRRNNEVEAVMRAGPRQIVSGPGRCAGHDGKRTGMPPEGAGAAALRSFVVSAID